jgi:HAE1 family hydrophobic/amphiphilic exporter-1
VTKNAILLVDYSKVLLGRGMERTEAVITAGRTRLRPILMTTLAMIFGMLPLALGIGAGAEMRAPMARAVVGGLITSTFLTLLVVPVVYTLLDDFAAWMRRRWDGKKAAAGAVVGLLVLLHGIPSLGPRAAVAADSAAVEILTLDDAIRIALENNRDIRKALELRNRLEGRYVEERAAALPQLFGSAEGFRSWDGTQGVFSIPPSSATVDAQLGVSQPLYTGGQVTAAIRAARVGLASVDDQLKISRQSALLEVSTAYYDILLAREMHSIAVQSRDQKARFLEEAKKRNAAGTATEYDVLVAKVDLENAQPAIVRARNLVVTLRERLRYLLGRGGPQVDVRGELAVEIAPWPDYESELARAVEKRPELSDLRHRIGVSGELVTIARSGDMPRLEARAGAGWKYFRSGDAGADGKTWAVGLFATWPLFDGMRTRGRVAQARSDRNTLRIEEAQLLDAIALQVRDAVNTVRDAGEVVRAIADTVGQAERLLSLAEKGYEYGVKTKLEVDDAQLNLSQAKGTLARSRRDYLIANAALLRAIGTLGEEREASYDRKPAFRPAGSPAGIFREVLGGRPALP